MILYIDERVILAEAYERVCVFQGGKEYLMRAHFGLPSVEAEDKEGKPPISVKFEIPYFTTSGIQVTKCAILTFITSGTLWLSVLFFMRGSQFLAISTCDMCFLSIISILLYFLFIF